MEEHICFPVSPSMSPQRNPTALQIVLTLTNLWGNISHSFGTALQYRNSYTDSEININFKYKLFFNFYKNEVKFSENASLTQLSPQLGEKLMEEEIEKYIIIVYIS